MAKNQRQENYSLRDLLDLVKKELMLALNCHGIATITSFDAEKQTVKAQLVYKQAYEQRDPRSGKYGTVLVNYPLLIDCPAIVMGGGGGALTFPVRAGDECVILFNDRDIDNWFKGAPNGDLASSRLHAFGDGIALIGIRSLLTALTDYDEERVRLAAELGAEIALKDKVRLQNTAVNFGDALDTLCTSLITAFGAATPTAGNPLSPAAVTAVTTFKAQMLLLLEGTGP